jgi:hypothetical protein
MGMFDQTARQASKLDGTAGDFANAEGRNNTAARINVSYLRVCPGTSRSAHAKSWATATRNPGRCGSPDNSWRTLTSSGSAPGR